MKPLIAVLMFCMSCNHAEYPAHNSILSDGGTTARVLLLDFQSKPVASADVKLSVIVQCATSLCPPVVMWQGKSDTNGIIVIPRTAIQESTLVGMPSHETRTLRSASWEKDKQAWSLWLMGRTEFICRQSDSPWTFRVADDWGSGRLSSTQLNPSNDFGLMHCWEEKGYFRKCMGPQMPDAGYTANLIGTNDSDISAVVSGETIHGPDKVAELTCSRLVTGADTFPENSKTWTLEYSIDGGIRPFHRALSLTQSGDLTVSNSSHRITGRASSEVMAKVTDFLKTAGKARPITPGPDQRSASFTLTSAGQTLELEASDAISELLVQTMDAMTKKALIGNWWESEWKFCHAVPQLTAEQMDPPIQTLTFRDDGQFSVSWPGGGAESPGRPGEPFIWVPDYTGSYSVFPAEDRVRLVFENGIHSPRDFAGDGDFELEDNKLVLRNLWLGTYKATQKPDICEMTFKRSKESLQASGRVHD
jgi:hypothetical protein